MVYKAHQQKRYDKAAEKRAGVCGTTRRTSHLLHVHQLEE
jgi:hypothetical protein